MKLVKIFANEQFTNIEFNESFNVVLATVKNSTNRKGTHGLGKTLLIHVIDFLLLGRSRDFLAKEGLKKQVYYAEILLNNGSYLVIKRSVAASTKVSFRLSSSTLQGFLPPEDWTEENLPFKKAKERLNEYLAFDVARNWSYRKSLAYFLRTQQDYSDVFQLSKFKKGHDKEWKPFVFELLGFDGELIRKKLFIEEEIQNKRDTVETLKREANINVEDKDKLLGMLDVKKHEKNIAQNSIEKFNFYTKDKEITTEVIENLNARIQALASRRYSVKYEIAKAEKSLQKSTSPVNVKKLIELYEETELYFPEILKKKFEELEKFNLAISKERGIYLKEELERLRIESDEIDTEIRELEDKKSKLLYLSIEADSYTKFKEYQKQLTEVGAEILIIQEKIKAIDRSIEIDSKIKELEKELESSIMRIKEAIEERKHANINQEFNRIITEIIGTNAIISIKQNKYGNVEYEADYLNSKSSSTSEAEGTSYKKLLCMAFDLSLLTVNSHKSFFRFVYHDGILEGLDDRIKMRLLYKVKELCKQYGLQYIVSLIDSDIPKEADGTPYKIEENEICLRLNDTGDEGKLFKYSF